MAGSTLGKSNSRMISALSARANFGKILDRMDDKQGSLVIAKHGRPRAVLLSVGDYLRLSTPEPDVLRIIGEEAERNGTSALNSDQIDRIIKNTRAQKRA